jgi:hypothetical protein
LKDLYCSLSADFLIEQMKTKIGGNNPDSVGRAVDLSGGIIRVTLEGHHRPPIFLSQLCHQSLGSGRQFAGQVESREFVQFRIPALC